MHELQLIVSTEVAGDQGGLSWQERALCAQTDPEAFFPEKGGSTREAKKVCVGCDVRASAWSTPSPTTSGSASGAGCPSASAAGSRSVAV